MTDYTDLIKRLLRISDFVYGDDLENAVEALKAQARRIAELRKEADMMHSEYRTARARIAELEAAQLAQDKLILDYYCSRITELEAALKPFADMKIAEATQWEGEIALYGIAARDLRTARAAYLGEKE